MINSIDSNLLLSNKQSEKTNGNTLGQDAFLKLLITQLQNQDPLNPMQDTEFISQMATFSSLEQLMSIKESLNTLQSTEKENQLILYNQFVGKEVTWHGVQTSDEEENIQIEEGTGTIVSIEYKEDGPLFHLDNGKEIRKENISQIHHSTESNMLVQASYLIGKQVSWSENDEILHAIVQAVSKKDNEMVYQLNNGSTITARDIVKIELPTNE